MNNDLIIEDITSSTRQVAQVGISFATEKKKQVDGALFGSSLGSAK